MSNVHSSPVFVQLAFVSQFGTNTFCHIIFPDAPYFSGIGVSSFLFRISFMQDFIIFRVANRYRQGNSCASAFSPFSS